MNSNACLESPPAAPEEPRFSTAATLSPRRSWLGWLALLIAICSILVRWLPEPGFKGVGLDATLYRTYALTLDARGASGYAPMTDAYLVNQRNPESMAKLPPTRILYVVAGWMWKRAEFGSAPPRAIEGREDIARDPMLVSLHRVSFVFSVMSVLLAGFAAWRMLGAGAGLGVLALMAFSPLQIHLGQHALIDSFFAFWVILALWSLWENLRRPNHPAWLTLYGASMAAMVMTKESAFFVAVALAAMLALNRWLRFGKVTPRLLLVTALAPAAGLAVVIAMCGGVGNFLEVFRILVPKVHQLAYAIETCNGPWHRYLLDLLTVSPATLLLAVGGAFCLLRGNREYAFLFAFTAITYAMMCNVRDGVNLRYASIWDLPLRALACGQIAWLAREFFPKRQTLVAAFAIAALCDYELRQYFVFFVDSNLYELATGGLLEAVKVLK